jgi:ribosomal protein L20
MGLIKEQRQILYKCRKNATEKLTIIRQAFSEESLLPYTSVWIACSVQDRPKNTRQVNSKIKSILIIVFDLKGIVHKEFVLARQTVSSAYYCDVLRRLRGNSVRTLATEKLAVASRQRTVSHSLFHQGIFNRKQMTAVPPPALPFSVSLIEVRTERPPFWHSWDDRGRIAGDAEHPHRTRFSGFI